MLDKFMNLIIQIQILSTRLLQNLIYHFYVSLKFSLFTKLLVNYLYKSSLLILASDKF